MPCIRSCWNDKCEYNRGGCYCDAEDIEIGTSGSCDTFVEKDIYKEVEGFSRESKSNI